MNDITIFNHLGNDIRVMTDNQGEPWFVLNDICDALEIGNPRNVVGRLDMDDVRQTDVIDKVGRNQKTNIINEAGLYEVIIRSDKPEAKAFRRWVTSEVLPSIRKHGMYATPATIEGEQLMNDITIFNHLGNDIRVMTDNQGEPWFVLNDICDALEIGNPRNVVGRLDMDDVRQTDVIDKVGRNQKTNIINEAGLYEVIIRSDKPEAKAFRRWVTSEVLPSIRKHGMYATPATIEDMIANPDMAIKLLMNLKEERAARAKAEAEIEAQRPVAALGKAIETADGDLTPSAFGKILSKTIKTMGPNKFCKWLLDNNFAFRNGQGKIIPMQDAVNRGILILTERVDPAGKIRPQLLVTPAGQSYFAGILSA